MEPSRIDTLQGPGGGRRLPGFALLVAAVLVLGSLAMGIWGWGWLAALLVPVVGFTLYLAGRVLFRLVGGTRPVRSDKSVRQGKKRMEKKGEDGRQVEDLTEGPERP